MRSTAFGAVLSLAVASALPTPGVAQRAPKGTVDGTPLALRIGEAVAAVEPELWGSVLVAVEGEVVFARGYGLQDHASVANGPRSLFDVGGLAGLWTFAGVLRLIDARRMQPDDPIARYLEGWPAERAVTVRHLLEQRSGLPMETDWQGGAANGSTGPAVAAIGRAAPVGEPGAAFAYSPLNQLLLAMLVEVRGGGDFATVMHKRVFKPGGMDDSVFFDERKLDDKRITWRLDGDKKPEPASTMLVNWSNRGCRGMLASVYDLHAFALALARGKVLGAEERAMLWQPMDGGDVLRIGRVEYGELEFLHAHGAVTGYRARLVVHEPSRSWIVLLTDQRGLDPVEAAIGAVLVEELARRAAPPVAASPAGETPAGAPGSSADGQPVGAPPAPAPVTGWQPQDEDLERFVGTFRPATGGTYQVRRRDRELVVHGAGLRPSAQLTLGVWPAGARERELRAREDRGLALLQGLLDGDRTGKAFAGDAAVAGHRLIDELVGQVGEGCSIRYTGTEAKAPVSWFRVEGRQTVDLAARWSRDGRFAALQRASGEPPFSCPFRLLRRDFAGAIVDGKVLTLTVEGVGAGRTLVLEEQGELVAAEWIGG